MARKRTWPVRIRDDIWMSVIRESNETGVSREAVVNRRVDVAPELQEALKYAVEGLACAQEGRKDFNWPRALQMAWIALDKAKRV